MAGGIVNHVYLPILVVQKVTIIKMPPIRATKLASRVLPLIASYLNDMYLQPSVTSKFIATCTAPRLSTGTWSDR
jgi:hypothetical protein